MSMPNLLRGRSRTWPLQATTSKSGPRYLLIVLALAGDSTMTRFFFFRAGTGGSSSMWSPWAVLFRSGIGAVCQGLLGVGRRSTVEALVKPRPVTRPFYCPVPSGEGASAARELVAVPPRKTSRVARPVRWGQARLLVLRERAPPCEGG